MGNLYDEQKQAAQDDSASGAIVSMWEAIEYEIAVSAVAYGVPELFSDQPIVFKQPIAFDQHAASQKIPILSIERLDGTEILRISRKRLH